VLRWEPSGDLLTYGTLGLERWPMRGDPAKPLTTGGGCRLWRVGSWDEGPEIGGADGCFSPVGKLLAVEESLGAIRLLRSETGKELVRLEAPE
jgi:hypothetical protein